MVDLGSGGTASALMAEVGLVEALSWVSWVALGNGGGLG